MLEGAVTDCGSHETSPKKRSLLVQEGNISLP